MRRSSPLIRFIAIALASATGFASSLTLAWGADLPRNPFAQRLLRSMEYIDFPDILIAIAAQNTQPWQRYDQGERYLGRRTPLEPRWNQVISMNLSGDISQQLSAIHNVFMEGSGGDFRETPIDDAGGDIDRDVGGPGGFDRLTLDELKALQANLLLVVEAKPDPYNTVTPGQTWLARYRYPSAGTYQKFKQLLSPELLRDLQSADQAGKLGYDLRHPESVSPEFRTLNKRLLAELLDTVYDPNGTPEANYQALITVHPFDDYNGRSLRAWYRQQVGHPMFLMNFYCDLYCGRSKFAAEIAQGDQQYQQIVEGLVAEEKRNPGYPRFYDIPDFWMVAAGKQSAPSDSAHFVSQSKAWFLRVENSQRIDHKLFGEVIRDYQTFLGSQGLAASFIERPFACETFLLSFL